MHTPSGFLIDPYGYIHAFLVFLDILKNDGRYYNSKSKNLLGDFLLFFFFLTGGGGNTLHKC